MPENVMQQLKKTGGIAVDFLKTFDSAG